MNKSSPSLSAGQTASQKLEFCQPVASPRGPAFNPEKHSFSYLRPMTSSSPLVSIFKKRLERMTVAATDLTDLIQIGPERKTS